MGVTTRALGHFVRQGVRRQGGGQGALPVDDTSAAPADVEYETPVAAATAALLRSTAEYVGRGAQRAEWLAVDVPEPVEDRQSDPRRGNVGAVETGQFEVIAQTRALMMFNANVALS